MKLQDLEFGLEWFMVSLLINSLLLPHLGWNLPMYYTRLCREPQYPVGTAEPDFYTGSVYNVMKGKEFWFPRYWVSPQNVLVEGNYFG